MQLHEDAPLLKRQSGQSGDSGFAALCCAKECIKRLEGASSPLCPTFWCRFAAVQRQPFAYQIQDIGRQGR